MSGQTECGALCDVLYWLIWVPGVLRDTMARAGRREAVDRGFEGWTCSGPDAGHCASSRPRDCVLYNEM